MENSCRVTQLVPACFSQNIILQAHLNRFEVLSTIRQFQCALGFGRIPQDERSTRNVYFTKKARTSMRRYAITISFWNIIKSFLLHIWKYMSQCILNFQHVQLYDVNVGEMWTYLSVLHECRTKRPESDLGHSGGSAVLIGYHAYLAFGAEQLRKRSGCLAWVT